MPKVSTIATVTAKGCAGGKMIVDAEKSKTWNKKDGVSQADVEEILKTLTEFNKAKEEFLNKMPGWKSTRQKTINELYDIANECDSLHRDCNIANVTGSSVGAAGGLMALGGLALAPFTFGASLSLTVAGAATGVAGAATNITTSIVESSKMKGNRFSILENLVQFEMFTLHRLGLTVLLLIYFRIC